MRCRTAFPIGLLAVLSIAAALAASPDRPVASESTVVAKAAALPPQHVVGTEENLAKTPGRRSDVPTRQALETLLLDGLVPGTSVERLGYAASGDGGQVTYTLSPNLCTIAGGDGGDQVAAAGGKGCWLAAPGPMSVLAWGADPGGSRDSTTAFAAAVAQGRQRTIQVPCGTFHVTTVRIEKPVQIEGAGQGCVALVGTTATDDVLRIAEGVGGYSISNVTIDRSLRATAGAGLSVDKNSSGSVRQVTAQNQFVGFALGPTARSYCDSCLAQDNYADGFFFFNAKDNINNQWVLTHALSQLNDGWGYRLDWTGNGSYDDTDPTFLYGTSYANTLGGFLFTGDPGASHNDLEMINPVSSSDGGNGFDFNAPGTNVTISNVFAELAGTTGTGRGGATPASHAGSGIAFDLGGRPMASAVLNGGFLAQNSSAGLMVDTQSKLQKLKVVGVVAWGNGAGRGVPAGFALHSLATTTVLSGIGAYDGGVKRQIYGLSLREAGINRNTYVSGADLTGNLKSDCSMPLSNKGAVAGNGC